jgi:hypothetical protein
MRRIPRGATGRSLSLRGPRQDKHPSAPHQADRSWQVNGLFYRLPLGRNCRSLGRAWFLLGQGRRRPDAGPRVTKGRLTKRTPVAGFLLERATLIIYSLGRTGRCCLKAAWKPDALF